MITKYRAYDKFNDEWTYSEVLGLAKFFTDYEMKLEGDNNVSLEQYINRKDANKKDIYQGDNLQIGTSPIYTVKWETDRWKMCGTKNGNGFCVEIPGYMEIIGNIHSEVINGTT